MVLRDDRTILEVGHINFLSDSENIAFGLLKSDFGYSHICCPVAKKGLEPSTPCGWSIFLVVIAQNHHRSKCLFFARFVVFY